MIEFNNVSKSFWTGTQRKVILDRVNLRVELGRSLGILAPNGTGKTTLINMIAGLEKPDEGEIRRSCRVSFPLGFMGGVVQRHNARENARYIASELANMSRLELENPEPETNILFYRTTGELSRPRVGRWARKRESGGSGSWPRDR